MTQEYQIWWIRYGQAEDTWVPGHKVNSLIAIQVFQAERVASYSECEVKQRRKVAKKAQEVAVAWGISESDVNIEKQEKNNLENKMGKKEQYKTCTQKK